MLGVKDIVAFQQFDLIAGQQGVGQQFQQAGLQLRRAEGKGDKAALSSHFA